MRKNRPDERAPLCARAGRQQSMDKAAKKVGIANLAHPNFRHAFAARRVENGLDILTV
jgi:hypothetical protein